MKFNALLLLLIFLAILGFSCGDSYTEGEDDYYNYYDPCEDCEYECQYEDCEVYVEEANERIAELESQLEELQTQYDDLEMEYNNCCY